MKTKIILTSIFERVVCWKVAFLLIKHKYSNQKCILNRCLAHHIADWQYLLIVRKKATMFKSISNQHKQANRKLLPFDQFVRFRIE